MCLKPCFKFKGREAFVRTKQQPTNHLMGLVANKKAHNISCWLALNCSPGGGSCASEAGGTELHPKVLPVAMWGRLNCLKCLGNLLRWKQVRLASVVDVFYWDGGCRHTNGERKLSAEWTVMNSLESMTSLFYYQPPPVWGLGGLCFKD